jgi:choline dehydrogenase/4-pyridoxate dehydrogenase
MSRYADPLVDAYIEAGVAAGHPFSDDYNGAQQEGFSRMQSTIRDGLRCSAADAYLRPAMRRANLRIEIRALATRVVFDGKRAVGVEYAKAGRRAIARAAREVILAGGVINTPQLLMLSGVGDPDELAAHGLTVQVPLRGVGRNLQDHVMAAVPYRRKAPGPFQRNMRLDRVARALGTAYLFGTGFATDLPSGLMGFVKVLPDARVPDVQILFHAGPRDARPYLPPFRRAFADGFAAVAAVLRPESRGRVALASADPATPVRIHQNFLAADRDWRTLRAGIRLVRAIAKQRSLAPYVAAEIAPGPGKDTDADLDAHIRATAITVHHPLGTCKMGLPSDPLAVVDPELRVYGASGLRVVDASAMPDLVGGNINAAVVMIAEKAADLIRGHAPLPPIDVG